MGVVRHVVTSNQAQEIWDTDISRWPTSLPACRIGLHLPHLHRLYLQKAVHSLREITAEVKKAAPFHFRIFIRAGMPKVA
jgi:hypothetical protein